MPDSAVKRLADTIAVARGKQPGDLLIVNAQVANVFTGELVPGNVVLKGSVIAGIGHGYQRGERVLDAGGTVLIPGLIDAHLHIESSLLLPGELARVALQHGTTAIIADPHEIANVLGESGIQFMLEASRHLPLDFFFTIPSCVPATGLETAGGEITAGQIKQLLKHPRVVGLGEMMNFPGVLSGKPEVLEKLAAAQRVGKLADGHAPGLSGADLQGYLCGGAASDHECTSAAEALEKVAAGMRVIIRQGSAAQNLADLLPAINEGNYHRFMLGCDDRDARDLLEEGHINAALRRAVHLGLPPLRALQIATLNTAVHYGLSGRGAIAPGYRADLALVDNLENFNVHLVVKDGRVVVEKCRLTVPCSAGKVDRAFRDTVRMPGRVTSENFELFLPPGPAPVIGIIPKQIITRKLLLEPLRDSRGAVRSDPLRDLLKIAVVERHRGSGRIGLGLVQGLGLREGAVASSVAHDSHNIIVAGVEERAMAGAVNTLRESGGGFVAVDGSGKVRALLPLPVAGLMSEKRAEEVAAGTAAVAAAARSLGAKPDNPYLTLSFLALPVIPELKITDRGLVEL